MHRVHEEGTKAENQSQPAEQFVSMGESICPKCYDYFHVRSVIVSQVPKALKSSDRRLTSRYGEVQHFRN